MFGNLKRFKAYFALILTVSVISFSASYDSKTTKNTTVPNPNMVDTFTLPANPGPTNNGGSAGWAIFFDLIAGTRSVTVTQMSTGNTAVASASFSVEVFTRSGTALGGSVSSGPGSSSAGWTSLGTVPVVQGSTANGISLVFTLPSISVSAGDTVGVALKFSVVGPRYYGTGSGPYSVYSDTNLRLVTGDVRSAPFTTTGSFFAPRVLTGVVRYVISTPSGVINIGTEILDGFKLLQNYPNPFNPTTNIKYQILKNSFVSLKVYDINGKEIAVLVNESQLHGTYETTFDASKYSSGVYFYKLTSNGFSDTKQMVLIK
jgi:hypothetical protein